MTEDDGRASYLREVVPLGARGVEGPSDFGAGATTASGVRPGAGVVRRDGRVTPRRLLGAFYTPDEVASILTSWALRGRSGTVLDPSYGGCAFLRAALTCLRAQGISTPEKLVFGVDIDRKCEQFDEGLVSAKNRMTANFLCLRPSDIEGAPFDAVVGNPPYVRHHWLKGRQRRAAAEVAARSGIKLSATASTWAYFVLHALEFLGPDGRLALLLPEAVLQADYARAVRDLLCRRFKRVVLIHVRNRVFRDTDESVVVLAADGQGPGTLISRSIQGPEDLSGVLDAPDSEQHARRDLGVNGREVNRSVFELMGHAIASNSVSTLGQMATLRIGIVTGANHFFIRSKDDIRKLGIPRRICEPVVGRTQWLNGLALTREDLVDLTERGRRTLLVCPTERTRRHPGVRRWIREGLVQKIDEHYKCTKRDIWYRVERGQKPGAFVTCSRLAAPLLVINGAACRCSNAVHMLRWLPALPVKPEAIAVAVLSSLTALWAEIHGRRYGGGILKLEPGTVRRMPIVLFSSLAEMFDEVDKLLRTGREEQARSLVDDTALRAGLGLSAKDVERLRVARLELAAQRIPKRTP